MFKRRLSRLRTTSFVIFSVSIIYFLEAVLRYFLISENSELQYALHKNSRILLARLTRTKQKQLQNDNKVENGYCQITVPDVENRVIDSNGTYCKIEDINKITRCCHKKLVYEHCKCCQNYHHCVGSCLKHKKVYLDSKSLEEGIFDSKMDDFFKNLPVAFLKHSEFSLQIWNEFDLCKSVCRTNSGSVKDGNLYSKQDKHFCFVEL